MFQIKVAVPTALITLLMIGMAMPVKGQDDAKPASQADDNNR